MSSLLEPAVSSPQQRQDNNNTPDYTIDMVNNRALGMIETIGFTAAVEGADAALKASNVNLLAVSKVGSGIVTILLTGDVAAVRAAVDAGGDAADKIGDVRATHIIPRLHTSVAVKMIHPIKPIIVSVEEGSTETEVLTLEKTRTDMPSDIVRADSKKKQTHKAVDTMDNLYNSHEDKIASEALRSEDLTNNSYQKPNFDEVDPPRTVQEQTNLRTAEEAKQEVFRKVNLQNGVELMEMNNQDLREMILKVDNTITNSKLKSMRKEELITYLQDAEKKYRGLE